MINFPYNILEIFWKQLDHVDLSGPYSIKANHKLIDVSIKRPKMLPLCMTMLASVNGQLEIVKVPKYIVKHF